MLEQLQQIEQVALTSLEQVSDEERLEGWRVTYLGRSSPLMQVFDKLGQLPKEERPLIGRRANEVKRALEAALAEQSALLQRSSLEKSLQSQRLDVTLPGRRMAPHLWGYGLPDLPLARGRDRRV